MMTKLKISVMVGAALGLLMALLSVPILAPATNCGGNAAALAVCKKYAVLAVLAEINGKAVFKFSEIAQYNRTDLASWSTNSWLGGAGLFVRTNFSLPKEGRVLVVVCRKQFDNVPQPTVWNFYRKNPAHAAGYSDGSAELISPTEYAALDLSEFDLLSVIVTNQNSMAQSPPP